MSKKGKPITKHGRDPFKKKRKRKKKNGLIELGKKKKR